MDNSMTEAQLLKALDTIWGSTITKDPAALTIGEWVEAAHKVGRGVSRETMRLRLNRRVAEGTMIRLTQMRQDSQGRWREQPAFKLVEGK